MVPSPFKKRLDKALPASTATAAESYAPDPRAMMSRDKLALYRHHLRQRGLHPQPTTAELATQQVGGDDQSDYDSDEDIARYRAEVAEAKRGITDTDRELAQYRTEVAKGKKAVAQSNRGTGTSASVAAPQREDQNVSGGASADQGTAWRRFSKGKQRSDQAPPSGSIRTNRYA